MNDPNKTITITIAGRPGSGKTCVAIAIQDMLRLHGFQDVVVNDPDVFGTPTDLNDARLDAIASSSSRSIVINTVGIAREPL